jgi:hypothetical protein
MTRRNKPKSTTENEMINESELLGTRQIVACPGLRSDKRDNKIEESLKERGDARVPLYDRRGGRPIRRKT